MDYFLWEFSRGLYCSHGDHLIASKTFENFTKLASSSCAHTVSALEIYERYQILFFNLNTYYKSIPMFYEYFEFM